MAYVLAKSSPEAEETIHAPQTILPRFSRFSQYYLPETSGSPSSSKASLVAQQKLGDFFPSLAPHSAISKTKYTDASLQQIAHLLRLSDQERWSSVPRLYTVLRNIGQLQLIDEFINEGFTDIWFPFTPNDIPPRLSTSIKTQFLTTQSVVFTQALDLEKKEGRHANFAADEPLWFESRGKLGRGASGVVDKVISLITLQEYARKRMRRGNNFTKSKREIKDFKAELAILKTVNHHHCVKLVGSYTDPVYLGLIMDPVADCDLGRFLAEALTNDKKSLLRGYFGCLASALRYLHDRQIRHRDIKPPNILVKGETVYLADFGIALDWSEMTRGTTTADTAKSPIYCAPEVARSEPRGQSADIWSLGCVFVEMVTVLKGSSVEDMRSNFKKTSGSYMFHHNIPACDQWLSDLQDKSTIDNPPIEWCRKMLLFDRNERCTASQLLEIIQIESEPDHSKYVNQSFCSDCCMDQEYVSSDENDNGEDPWADSEEEDTLRAQGVSIQKPELGHMPDIMELGSGKNMPKVPDLPPLGSLAITSRPEKAWKPWGGLSDALSEPTPSEVTKDAYDWELSSLGAAGDYEPEPHLRKQHLPKNKSHNKSQLEKLLTKEKMGELIRAHANIAREEPGVETWMRSGAEIDKIIKEREKKEDQMGGMQYQGYQAALVREMAEQEKQTRTVIERQEGIKEQEENEEQWEETEKRELDKQIFTEPEVSEKRGLDANDARKRRSASQRPNAISGNVGPGKQEENAEVAKEETPVAPATQEKTRRQRIEARAGAQDQKRQEMTRRGRDETGVSAEEQKRMMREGREAVLRAEEAEAEKRSPLFEGFFYSDGGEGKESLNCGEDSGEETIESRFAKVKARVAEFAANVDTPKSQTAEPRSIQKVSNDSKTIARVPVPSPRAYRKDETALSQPAMNPTNIGRAYPMLNFSKTPGITLPMARNVVPVTITIDSAYNLKKDRPLFRIPDPIAVYLKVVGGKTYTTHLVRKTTNPHWHVPFDLRVTKYTIVEFDIRDWKNSSSPSSSLGTALIHMEDYWDKIPRRAKWIGLPLIDNNTRPNGRIDITIKVDWPSPYRQQYKA